MDHAIILLPEFLITLLALAILVFGRSFPRIVPVLTTYGLIVALGVLVGQAQTGALGAAAFGETIQIGPFAWVLRGAILAMAAGASAIAWGESPRRPDLSFGLLAISTVGAMILAGAADLVILFLGFALLGFPLVGWLALSRSPAGAEASMKLFVTAAVASGILLFGLTWLYGLRGGTSFAALSAALQNPDPLLTFVLLLTLGGLAFPLAAFPFHAWLPDVTEGGDAALGAWVLGGAALGVLAALSRVLMMLFSAHSGLWAPYLAALAVLSLLGGGLLAVAQADLRRMLAYFGVTSAGMAMLALLAAAHPASSQAALSALLMMALGATGATLGLFAGFSAANVKTLPELSGLHRRHPGVAFGLTLSALALAALPFSLAFWARLTLARALLLYVSNSLQFWAIALAVLAMAVTVMGAYTALRIPRAIFRGPAEGPATPREAPAAPLAVLALCALLSVFFFLAPAPFWGLVSAATLGF